MVGFALWAIPLAHGQGQRFENMPTRITTLAGREEAIHHSNFFPVPLGFVLQLSAKHTQSRVGQAPSQTVIFDHASDVQVFDANYVKPADQVGCDLVGVVIPGIGNASVDFSNSKLCLLPPVAAFLPPRQYSLGAGKFSLVLSDMLRVWDSLPIGKSCQSGNTEIDTDNLTSLRIPLNWFVQSESHEVTASRVLGYRDGAGVTCETSGPTNPESPNLGENKRFIRSIPSECGSSVLGGLLPSLFLERRIASAFFKEILVGSLQVPECLLLGHARNIIEPLVFRGFFQLGQRGGRGVVVDGLASLEAIGAHAQSPVVDEAAATKSLCQTLLLCGARVEPEFVFHVHKNSLLLVRLAVNLFLKGEALPPHA